MLEFKRSVQKHPNVSAHGTDWDHLAAVSDKDIAQAVARDPDAAPIHTMDEMRKSYKPHPPRIKR